ncbi:hypothetical protein [Curvivirga sp.]|uniref:hypothetical protein n=1 Tax=Curvivirga sp. TaxID=2856848 RepID=UPI003B5C5014
MKYISILHLVCLSVLTVMISACNSTRETHYQGKEISTSFFQREVQFELEEEYFRQAPECITVLPIVDENGTTLKTSKTIEAAFTRHLYSKVNRVIGPQDRDTLSRQLAFDLNHQSDRQVWKANRNCYHFISLHPLDDQGNYLFFWSRKAVGVEARITTNGSDDILWRGRHIADRHNGGLPLTPLDAAVAIFEANSLAFDDDIHHSLADDLARRILATLPNLRDPLSSY